MCDHFLKRIVSGGQTGVDRGALRAAISLGVPHGGWCPAGRRAEDGTSPAEFELTETRSRQYRVRTRLNVRDSDGTLILCRGELSGGTLLTHQLAERLGRPCLVVDLSGDHSEAARIAVVRKWLSSERIETLNAAGPRESNSAGIEDASEAFLVLAVGS